MERRSDKLSRASRRWLGALLVAGVAASVAAPAYAHDDGPPGYSCPDDGPFGVPGLQGPPDEVGQWGPVMAWPTQATHASLLPTAKVLFWRSGPTSYTWDPATDAIEPVPTASNTFCSGHATLADGTVIVVGGTGSGNGQDFSLPDINLFDPIAEAWTRISDMTYGRWYPTATTLPDGRILVTAGKQSHLPYASSDIPEIYDPLTGAWTEYPVAEQKLDLYPYNFVLSDGDVFMAGPDSDSLRFDPDAMTWQTVATPIYGVFSGTAVMYRPDQVLMVGGDEPAIIGAEVIDLSDASPAWRAIDTPEFPRRNLDLVSLPDGSVLAVGGAVDGDSSPECAVHAASLWDPVSEQWTTVASTAKPRMYHSTALLLADGRVLSAGGENSHVGGGERSAEVFSPPYLFKGARPIVSTAPATVTFGQVFAVDTPDAATIVSVALLKPGAVTHQFDQNQRYVPLGFSASANRLDVTAPADANVAPVGVYMLFLVDASGVPSIAHFVRVAAACSDAQDNDADALFDYPDDPGCRDARDRSEGPDCSDGLDNDRDGTIDAADPGCADATDPSETSQAGCDDGIDNDGDGIIDFPHDPGCASAVDATETAAGAACDDGIDNDGDGTFDFPGDPGCVGLGDPDETDPGLLCDDGIDNDGDGTIDSPDDPQCPTPDSANEGSDVDFDGVEDVDDNCPQTPNPTQLDTDSDGDGDSCDADDDGDGLVDAIESDSGVFVSAADPGTDPLLYDTDADGIHDGLEVGAFGSNPLLADTDADMLSDGDELYWGTDPNDPDTDGDILWDVFEIGIGTNPTLVDSDADGLTDREEFTGYHTDPTRSDTDGDGWSDGAEVAAGTDPLDPADAPAGSPPIPALGRAGTAGLLVALSLFGARGLRRRVG